MTVFSQILIAGFAILLANRTILRPFNKKIPKLRVLLWFLGSVMYIVGAFGQIGLYLGASNLQSLAIAGTGLFVVAVISINFLLKKFGLDRDDDELVNTSATTRGKWVDNKGIVEFERDGAIFVRPGSSDQNYEDGETVVILSVDPKSGAVEVTPSLKSKKIVANT